MTASTVAAATRLLADVPAGRREPWDRHLARFGPLPPATGLLETLEASGLRGRGGAGFPTARKWAAVAAGRGPAVVVANGAEGEPASRKDAVLLATRPHLVLDGAQLAALALGADEVTVWVGAAEPHLRAALAERAGDPLPVRVLGAPDRFISGEESAVVNGVEGRPAIPRFTPPRVFERGVHGRPTLVQNVETLAHVALLARYGADWFRSAGTADEPGTLLLTVSGAVGRPGVVELPLGVPLGDAVAAAGGASGPLQAVLVGGYHGAWLPPAALDVPLTHGDLRAAGGALGAGVVVAWPVGACGVTETARIARLLARDGAGQCGPCLNGLPAIAQELTALAAGRPEASAARVRRWAGMVEGRGACRHPDGTVRMVRSALGAFAADFAAHERGRPCA